MRIKLLEGVAAIAVLAASMGPLSAPVAAETLNEALSATYRYNPQLDAERARLRAVDEEVARAKSGYRPDVSATGDLASRNTRATTRALDTVVGSPTLGTRLSDQTSTGTNPRGYSLDLQQNLFNGFQTTNAVREAEAGVRAGREILRATEESVLLEAVTAYMDVVRDQAVVKLRENNVEVLSRDLKATQDRFSVGEVTRTDVAQSQARRALAVADLDLARGNLKTSRATFERVVGHAPSKLVEPSGNLRILPKSLDEAIALGTQENPNVVAALYREQSARHSVDRIRGELLPRVDLQASYQDRFDEGEGLQEEKTALVRGVLTVPIYPGGGEVYARVRQAKHTHVSLLQEVEQFRTLVQQQVVAAWAALQASRARVESDQVQVKANQVALQGVREEEKVGQRTLLDVLDAEQELLNSQVALVTDRRDVVVAAYALLSAVGRLNVSTLEVASNVYDPETHYFEVRRKWWGISITHNDGHREFLDLWSTHGERAEQQGPLK